MAVFTAEAAVLANDLQQLTIVLVRTRNPLNVGAVARSAVGAGAVLGEAREFASVAEAVADCRLVIGTTAARRRELQQPLFGLEQAAAPVHAAPADFTKRTCMPSFNPTLSPSSSPPDFALPGIATPYHCPARRCAAASAPFPSADVYPHLSHEAAAASGAPPPP